MRFRLTTALVVALVAGGGYAVKSADDSGTGSRPAYGAQVASQPRLGPAPGAGRGTATPGPSGLPSGSPSAGSPTTPRPTPTPTHKATPKATPKPTKTYPPAGGSMVNQLLAQINALRAQHGLPAYTLLSGLEKSAHLHNLKMAGGCGMSHQCPGEAGLGARITAQGVSWSSCGENVGWSGPHPNTTSAMIAAAEGLTTSMYNEKPPDDGHRRNLLSTSFHHIGIDVVRDANGRVWLTQDFSS